MGGVDYEKEYKDRIKIIFSKAFVYLDRYKHIRAEDDWREALKDLEEPTDPLEKELFIAVVNELEREYKSQSTV